MLVTFTAEELMRLTPEELDELKVKREAEYRKRWEEADGGGPSFNDLCRQMHLGECDTHRPPTVGDLHYDARKLGL